MDDFIFTNLGQKGVITSCNPWSITLKRPIWHFRTTFSAFRSTRHHKSLSSLNKSMLKRLHNNFIWLIFGTTSAPDPRVPPKIIHPHINWKCFHQTSGLPSLAYILPTKHFSAQSINFALLLPSLVKLLHTVHCGINSTHSCIIFYMVMMLGAFTGLWDSDCTGNPNTHQSTTRVALNFCSGPTLCSRV